MRFLALLGMTKRTIELVCHSEAKPRNLTVILMFFRYIIFSARAGFSLDNGSIGMV